ncbi:MAG: polymer-forming cytoskeletal protein [Gemmatimonadaceae bacterium]
MSLFNKNGGGRVAARQELVTPDAALSVIGAGMKVIGDIESTGVIKVDGVVEGSIRTAKQVLLGRAGSVLGDICADEVVLGGKIVGSVLASQRAEVQSTCTVEGNIQTKCIVVLEGGVINGMVQMNGAGAQSNARGTLALSQ